MKPYTPYFRKENCFHIIFHLMTFRNVSSYSQAQAAPLLENGLGNKFGGGDHCAMCGKTVYFAEKVMGANNVSWLPYIALNC